LGGAVKWKCHVVPVVRGDLRGKQMTNNADDKKSKQPPTQDSEKICGFAPDQEHADEGDEILYRKTRSFEEWVESSERCLRHVTERLDQIEEEINTNDDSRNKTGEK